MTGQISVSAQAAVESLITSLHEWLTQLIWYPSCQVTSVADADSGWVVCRIQDGTNQRCGWKKLFAIAVGDYVDVLYDPRTMQFEVFKRGGATVWSDTTFNIDQDSIRVEYTNSSTGTLNLGEVVVFDSGADLAVDTTTTAGDLTVAGVVVVGGAVGSLVEVAQLGIADILVNGNVTRGQFLRSSTTVGQAEPVSTTLYPGVFGIALTGNAAGAGSTVRAFLVGHTWDTADFDILANFAAGITFDGASAANVVTVPDNVAQALNIVDAGDANDYITIVSTDGSREVVVNQDAYANIDFRVEAAGVADAFQVQGSDGQITLGLLAAGLLESDAGGVITSDYTINSTVTMASGMDIDPTDASGQDLGDATHRWDLYTQDVIFGGASGANVITIPDAQAVGFKIEGNALEYVRIDTVAQREVWFNPGSQDVDFKISASGAANAFFVEGATGNVAVGTSTPAAAYLFTIYGDSAGDIIGSIQNDEDTSGRAMWRISNSGVVNYDLYAYGWNSVGNVYGVAQAGLALINFGGSVTKSLFMNAGNYPMYFGTNSTIRLILSGTGHFYPNSVKTHDLGDETHEWRTVHCNAVDTTCGRLVRATRICPVCSTEMMRGAGTLFVGGEESDYALAHCPKCGCAGVEEIKHLSPEKLLERRPAPKVVLEDVQVHVSGNRRHVSVYFRYGEDVLDVEGMVAEQAVRNATRLGEYEVDEFLKMSKKEGLAFLLALGKREWDSREETRLAQEEASSLRLAVNPKVRPWLGKDLLEVALPN